MPCCNESSCASNAKQALDSLRWRRALWIALAVNAGFFAAEIVAGAAAGSAALQADALDFLGDSANYAISLGVVGMALVWRSRAALLKGWTLIAFALWVLGSTAWHAWFGTLPRAEVMGVVGTAALLANGGVALMLHRLRAGDANRRSVWVCSRNDAIGNLAVMLAAAGVFGTGTGWPDVTVAAIMGGRGLSGGLSIVRQARGELSRGGLSSPFQPGWPCSKHPIGFLAFLSAASCSTRRRRGRLSGRFPSRRHPAATARRGGHRCRRHREAARA